MKTELFDPKYDCGMRNWKNFGTNLEYLDHYWNLYKGIKNVWHQNKDFDQSINCRKKGVEFILEASSYTSPP